MKTTSNYLSFAMLTLALSALPAHGAETAPAFADSKPWKMHSGDGHEGTLTINPDGTGKVDAGFIKMGVSWKQKGADTCLSFGIMGSHCLVFKAVSGGFDGYEKGKLGMSLRRP